MLKGWGSSSYLLGVKKSCFGTVTSFAVPFRVLSQKNVCVPLSSKIFQDTLTRCLLFPLGVLFKLSDEHFCPFCMGDTRGLAKMMSS